VVKNKNVAGEAGILLHIFGKFMILKLKSSRLSYILVLSWPLSSNSKYKSKNDADEAVSVVSLINWFAMQGPVAIILISWNVIFICETGYWNRAMKRFALFDLLKSLYSDTKILSKNIFDKLRKEDLKRCVFHSQ
jgi:hypothetical protein